VYNYKTGDGYPLGQWVGVQRKAKDKMDPEYRQRLESLPEWSWDALSYKWEQGFAHLRGFTEREGHCRIAQNYKTGDGYPLGQWAGVQRKAKATMDADRLRRLEALPGWSWDILSDKWDEGFSYLKQFSDREGHCRVANRYNTDDGYPLGEWVLRQRQAKEKMDLDRRRRLEALMGWSWGILFDQWEEGFTHLKDFAERVGHCRVPKKHTTGEGYKLGQWVGVQRRSGDKMDPDRRQRLEALPSWSWEVLSDQWEVGFSHLKQFSKQRGHCRAPKGFKTDDGYRLGQWITNQRITKDKMDPVRRQRLEALPGWSWEVLSDQWEKNFSHLQRFWEREGHCRVSQHYKTDDGFRLGFWVSHQRANKDSMAPDRRERLEALPGWVWIAEKPRNRTDENERLTKPQQLEG
jgi:hypothetical protein